MIERIRIFRYRLPLVRSLVTPAGVLHEREGYLLELTSEGHVGYGDMAPLPGFSPEAGRRNLVKALAERCRDLSEPPLEECEIEEDDGTVFYATFGQKRRLFGGRRRRLATTANVGYVAAQMDLLVRSGVRSSGAASVAVNGLLDPRADDINRQLERLRENKFRVVKVKTGGREPREAVKLAQFAAGVLGADVALRFDANRGWNLEEALEFCEGIRDLNVEYLEEPLRDPAQAEELRSRTGVALAADESLREGECPWADVWVIKPTLDGNYLPRLYNARDCGKRAVVSACFESGVGIAGLARQAAHHAASAQSACGLDTYHWLARDVLGVPLKFSDGRLDLADVAASMDTVDTSGLECVYDE